MTGQSNLTVAIFGATGGIGAAFVRTLAGRDDVGRVWAGSRSASPFEHAKVTPFAFDLGDEQSVRDAAEVMASDPPQLVIAATGVLTLEDGTGPERTYRKLDPAAMAQVLALNAIGPALIAKHMLPLFVRDQRCVFAALSARVGSIGDNGIGGWHSYRASKAALNMLLKNFALELGRTHKHAVIAGLHPGTVDSELSAPFQSGLPEGQLFTADQSAGYLLDVIEGLGPDDSGGVFDWQGDRLPA